MSHLCYGGRQFQHRGRFDDQLARPRVGEGLEFERGGCILHLWFAVSGWEQRVRAAYWRLVAKDRYLDAMICMDIPAEWVSNWFCTGHTDL